VNVPSELKYTKTHEWVRLEGEIAIDVPTPGRMLAKGDSLGSVESVKTVSDAYAPIAGEVVEVNGALGAQSELLNSDPYGDGWIVKLRVEDASLVDTLLDAEAYKQEIGG